MPILTVAQIDRVRLQANVSDRDIARVKLGNVVTARFDKYPDLVIRGRVTTIFPLSDQLSRTAVVESVVPNPGHRLFPGDAVKMQITTSRLSDVISVPLSAIVQKGGRTHVWVVREEVLRGPKEYYCTMHPEVVSDKPGSCPKCLMALVAKRKAGAKKAHLVTVRTGAADGRRVVIVKGLREGDQVIYEGNEYLREGDPVHPTRVDLEPLGPAAKPARSGPMPGVRHGGRDMKGMPGM